MRALVFGDNHVGAAVRGTLTPERLAEQEQNLRDALALARRENVDVVLHAGDLFQARRPEPTVMLAAERPLVEHRGAGGPPIVMVNGNHCVAGTATDCAIDVFAQAGLIELHRRPGITYADPGAAFPEATIACLPWASVAHIRAAYGGGDSGDVNLLAADLLLKAAEDLRGEIDGPAVLLSHFSVTGASLPNGLVVEEKASEPILPLDDLAEIGFDAVVLGHIHKAQRLDPRPPLTCPIFYVGSPLALNFGEADGDHGVWLLDIDGHDRQALFVPLESRRFVTIDCDSDPTDADSRYGLLWPNPVPLVHEAYVKLRYSAFPDHARRIDHAELTDYLLGEGAHQVWIEPHIVRESRARVAALDETVSDTDALDLWLGTQEMGDDAKVALRRMHAGYLEAVTT